MARHHYYKISNAGSNDHQARWMVSIELPTKLSYKLNRGVKITRWDEQTIVQCDSMEPIEDYPWTDALDPPIVSNRFKQLLEQHAVDCAQYLPVVMTHRGRALKIQKFWIANWLRLVECLDVPKSGLIPNLLDPERPDYVRLVIDPARTGDAKIFRIQEYSVVVLVRSDLRQILEDEGITGCQFLDIHHSTDTLPKLKPFVHQFVSFGIRDDSVPASEQLGVLNRFFKKLKPPYSDPVLGHCTLGKLEKLVCSAGNRVGLDWKEDKAIELVRIVRRAKTHSHDTFLLHVQEPHSKSRDLAYFHFWKAKSDDVRFAFWGNPWFLEFISGLYREIDVE